jgi:thioredoxin 1
LSKKVKEVTDKTIQEFLKEHPIAVVDFWNPMCGPCNELTPVFEELATEYAGRCDFGKMNVAKDNGLDPYLRQKYLDGQGVPVLLFYKNGHRIDRILGYYPEETPKKIRQIIWGLMK